MQSHPDSSSSSSPGALKTMVAQLGQLLNISLKLNSTQDVQQLLSFILDTATDVLECEAASLILYDEKRGELLFTASTNFDPAVMASIPVPLEGSLAGTIFRENKPLLINDVSKDPRHFGRVGEKVALQTRSLLGVPMVVRDKVTGVLEAINKKGGGFVQKDTHLLSVIASQAAVAIHNAQLVQALKMANEELERSDKLKSDFMAIASHELRTPLGIILGYATFLQEEVEGELSEHADRVLNSALHMRTLIEDMTNMNLMRMGSLSLQLSRIPLQQVVRGALEEVRMALSAQEHSMRIQIPKEPLHIQADEENLRQVFVNVLNNAIRFTPKGGRLVIRAEKTKGEVLLAVADNGIGIPPAELERIFEAFYQVEDHMVRHHGGLGLGLSIARGLVSLHKGRIWAESHGNGTGTMVYIALPAG